MAMNAFGMTDADIPREKTVAIIQCWSLSKGDLWTDTYPSCTKRTLEGLIHITAWFDSQQPNNSISARLAGKLLATKNQAEYIGIKYYIADRTIAISRLHIVRGLPHDIVINSNSSTASSPEWSFIECSGWYIVKNADFSTENHDALDQRQAELKPHDVSDHSSTPAQLDDEKPVPCYAAYEPAQILELASQNGFLITNYQSLRTFAALIHVSCPLCHRTDDKICNSWIQIDRASLESTPQMEDNTSQKKVDLPDTLILEQPHWDEISWSTTASEPLGGATSQQPPPLQTPSSNSPRRKSWLEIDQESEYTNNFSSSHDFAKAPRTFSDESSSEVTNEGSDFWAQGHGESSVLSDSLSEINPSMSEFLIHPGHDIWKWDIEQQRWRKREGHAGDDWYPDNFA